jgi:DNA-binding CsgD family transcriptional regulator
VRLLEQDVRRVLEVVHDVIAAPDVGGFPLELLDRLRDLIPCGNIAYFEWDTAGRRLARYEYSGFEVPAAVDEAMLELGRELPWSVRRLAPEVAVRIGGLIGHRELVRSAFYIEGWRPIGVTDELKLRLRTEPSRVAGFSLLGASRFSERDRVVLSLLAPHLSRARDRRGFDASALSRLTSREKEVLALVDRGRTNKQIAASLGIEAGTVRKHLENAFAKLGVHTRTAAVAQLFRPPDTY